MMLLDGSDPRVAVQQIVSDEPQRNHLSSNPPSSIAGASSILAVTQPQGDLHNWLSPTAPEKIHNIACMVRHEATAEWFLEDSTFKRWNSTMSTDSLLWVHGKRGSVFLPSRFDCS